MTKNIFISVATMLVLLNIPSMAQLREHPDKSLTGLNGVYVVVNYKGPEISGARLTQNQLMRTVESQLKADNFAVLDRNSWEHEKGKPYLCITIVGTTTGSQKKPLYYFSIAVDFIQKVFLDRKTTITSEGSTWNQDYAIVTKEDDLREVVVKVSDAVHEFVQSVQEANK